MSLNNDGTTSNNGNIIPATPGEISVGGLVGGNNNFITMNNNPYSLVSSTGVGEDEWIEISHDQLYIPRPEDVGRKLKVEAAAYSLDTGDLLMHRVVKTDLVLSRTPEPEKRNLVTAKPAGGGGARFRIVTYNILAEIYATQQQYPYADLWALSWDFR
jgi:CCR4-NOT transcription complex subunit 6